MAMASPRGTAKRRISRTTPMITTVLSTVVKVSPVRARTGRGDAPSSPDSPDRVSVRQPRGSLTPMAKRVVIVGLVLLLILLAVPIGISMVMAPCPECSLPLAPGIAMCLAVLAGLATILLQFLASVELISRRPRCLLLASMYERPPRFA